MINLRATVVAGAALLGTVTGAGAADLYGRGGSLKDGGYAPIAAESPHRWYVRIDGGYVGYDKPNSVLNFDGLQTEVIDPNLESTWSLGGGLGVYFTRNVRADITYTHMFQNDFSGRWTQEIPGGGPAGCANPCGTAQGATNVNVRGVNAMRSDLILANVYYDFDTRSHFTPYIGFGLGGVKHQVKAGTLASTDGTVTGVIDAYDNWHVAGAAMAGFSVALRSNLHFDAGYRFLYLGETSTGAVRVNRPTNTANPTPMQVVAGQDPTIEDLHAHEFRFGLRYDFR